MNIQIDPAILSRAIRACAIASFTSAKAKAWRKYRPAMRGVLLQALRGGQLDVVGTDGRWIARYRADVSIVVTSPGVSTTTCNGAVIEPASVKPLCAWLDMHGDDELVRINVGPVAEARSERGSAHAFATRDADTYPRYEQVIPDNAHGKGAPVVEFDGTLLSKIIKAFRIASNIKRGHMMPLMFQFEAKTNDPAIVTCPSAPDMIGALAFATRDADTYPRYEQVIPDNAHGKGAPVVEFDGALLSEVVEAFRIASSAKRGRAVPLMFQFGASANDPVIVTCSSAPDMIALVMPLMQPDVGQYSLTTERA